MARDDERDITSSASLAAPTSSTTFNPTTDTSAATAATVAPTPLRTRGTSFATSLYRRLTEPLSPSALLAPWLSPPTSPTATASGPSDPSLSFDPSGSFGSSGAHATNWAEMPSSTTHLDGVLHQAPRRSESPFHPPPLTGLTLRAPRSAVATGLVLSRALAEEIRLLLPARLQLASHWTLIYSIQLDGVSLGTLYHKCDEYKRLQHGFVLVIKDALGGVFGAYLTEAPHPNPHYFGTGECFLWRATILPVDALLNSLPPPPSADTTNLQRSTTIASADTASSHHRSSSASKPRHDQLPTDPAHLQTSSSHSRAPSNPRTNAHSHSKSNSRDLLSPWSPGSIASPGGGGIDARAAPGPAASPEASRSPASLSPVMPSSTASRSGTSTPDRLRFKAYPYSGVNDYLIFCQTDFLSIGGGDGRYGLWLDSSLERGISSPCLTFGNEALSDEGANFEVMDVEIWQIGD